MDLKERRTSLAGIDLGEKGDARNPALTKLNTLGVTIPPNTLSQIRGGYMSGGFVALQLACTLLLEKNDASLKNSIYHQIIQSGLAIEEEAERHRKRVTSTDLLSAVSDETGFKRTDIVRSLRAIRVDMIYSNPSVEGSVTQELIRKAQIFITDKIRVDSIPVTKLQNNWEPQTLTDFYKLLYGSGSNGTIGSWVPYELSVLHAFYLDQKTSGNHLTFFDRVVLENGRAPLTRSTNLRARDRLATDIREQTGIKVDTGILSLHRSTLIYGNFNRTP